MTTMHEPETSVAAQRDALTTLIARFSADRDSLATLVAQCREELGELASRVETAATAGEPAEADAELRAELIELRGTVSSLRAAVESRPERTGDVETEPGPSTALESRIDRVGTEATRSIATLEQRLADEIAQLRAELRAAAAAPAASAEPAGEPATLALSALETRVAGHSAELRVNARNVGALREGVARASREASEAVACAREAKALAERLAEELALAVADGEARGLALGRRLDAVEGGRPDLERRIATRLDRASADLAAQVKTVHERLLDCLTTLDRHVRTHDDEIASLSETQDTLAERLETDPLARLRARLEHEVAAALDVARDAAAAVRDPRQWSVGVEALAARLRAWGVPAAWSWLAGR